jgi:hypothetical protein
MVSQHRNNSPPEASCVVTRYPALAGLGLNDVDLSELAAQGFVCAERRGFRTYYKLRFRRAGKQVVRYVGDRERAEAIARDLDALQANTESVRHLGHLAKQARKYLRQEKLALEPVLAANGWAFHGLAVRRPRQ